MSVNALLHVSTHVYCTHVAPVSGARAAAGPLCFTDFMCVLDPQCCPLFLCLFVCFQAYWVFASRGD